jgi:TolA-binding protein
MVDRMSRGNALAFAGPEWSPLLTLLGRALVGALVIWLLTVVTAAQTGVVYPLTAPAGMNGPRLPGPDTCLACFRATEPMVCHQVAVDLAMHRDYTRAIAIEEMVHGQHPESVEVVAALAKMYHDGMRNTARATELYHAAMALHPGYPPALMGLGTLMQDRGESDVAIAYFRRVVRDNPAEPHFKVRLAEALVRGGREAEAAPILTEIVDRWPGTTEATTARGLMTRPALAKP